MAQLKRHQNSPYFAAGMTAFCVIAASLVFLFALIHFDSVQGFFNLLGVILRPIFYGLVLAFLLLPIQRHVFTFLTSMTPDTKLADPHNVKFLHFVSILASMVFAAFMIYLLLAMVIPQVYLSIVGLIDALPGYAYGVHAWIQAFLSDNPQFYESIKPFYDYIADILRNWLMQDMLPNLESVGSTLAWLESALWPSLSSVATGVTAVIVYILNLLKDLLIAVIVSVYLLVRKDRFAAQAKKIVYSTFTPKQGDLIVEETRNAYRILSGFINGKLLDSLIIGIICLICCNIFKFPYPALVATIVGVTNVIPFFGPFIGAIPCILLILLVNPIQSIYFAIFILALQQFDGNILGPKILGDSTGLDAFWVLFSILLFGGLFGFAGMVMGVPVFAMIYSILNRLVRNGLTKRNLPVETEHYLGKTKPMATVESGSDET